MMSFLSTFSGYWVYEVKYPHFLTVCNLRSWTVLPDSEFLKWPNSLWNEETGQFFVVFYKWKQVCQLFLALDFSCLKEVEGITTNPFNQNILEFWFQFEKKQIWFKSSSETKGEINLFTIISSQRYFFYYISFCKDISIFFLSHYFQGTKTLLKRFFKNIIFSMIM